MKSKYLIVLIRDGDENTPLKKLTTATCDSDEFDKMLFDLAAQELAKGEVMHCVVQDEYESVYTYSLAKQKTKGVTGIAITPINELSQRKLLGMKEPN
jgi:dsDNA-binding SOS-regulon protein